MVQMKSHPLSCWRWNPVLYCVVVDAVGWTAAGGGTSKAEDMLTGRLGGEGNRAACGVNGEVSASRDAKSLCYRARQSVRVSSHSNCIQASPLSGIPLRNRADPRSGTTFLLNCLTHDRWMKQNGTGQDDIVLSKHKCDACDTTPAILAPARFSQLQRV